MRITNPIKTLAATVVTAGLLLAAASTAAAAPVPATFVGASGNATLSGTLTVGFLSQSMTCPITQSYVGFSNSGSPSQGALTILMTGGTCTNGNTLGINLTSKAWKDAGVYTINSTGSGGTGGHNPYYSSPSNVWYTAAWSAPATWTNGNATTPSRITFNNTTVGNDGLYPIRFTGTINIARTNGTLLTLQ